MSDIADSSSSPIPRASGRFIKGGPGGPGRPRGSLGRRKTGPRIIVLVVTPAPGLGSDAVLQDHKRRLAVIDTSLEDLMCRRAKARQNRFQRFSARFRRFFTERLMRKSQRVQGHGRADGSCAV